MVAQRLTVLFSAAPRFYRFAVQELRRTLPVTKHKAIGDDAGLIRLDGTGLAETAAACRRGDVRFVRHLAEVQAELPAAEIRADAPEEALRTLADLVDNVDLGVRGSPIALQVWPSGRSAFNAETVREHLGSHLALQDRPVSRSGADHVLSVCLGEKRIVIGFNPTADALCDWPGGRLRLSDSPERIARAEFKLEELFMLLPSQVNGRPLEIAGPGLDLGASPGGWTRILLERGASPVHAVDPGEPASSLPGRPDVVWHRATAGAFLDQTQERFRTIVNDMRMDPLISAQTMIKAAEHQQPGDVAIVTLKLTADHATDQADEAMAVLAERYDIVFARQLHHNRHELTVVGTRTRRI